MKKKLLKKIFSRLTLITILSLSILFVQCDCRKNKLDLRNDVQPEPQKQEETPPPPTIKPITDDMIERAKNGDFSNSDPNYSWLSGDFLASKLQSFKDQVNGVDINEQNPEERNLSALHYATLLGGAPDIVQALLDRGADRRAQNSDGLTPLDLALLKDPLDVEIVKLLVSKLTKEEINAVDNKGNTLLHKALSNGNEELAKILLTHPDINVDIPGKHNKTPLHLAAQWGNLEIVTSLLNKGAKVGIKTNQDKTPLDLALLKDPLDVEIVKLLVNKLTKEEINAVDNQGHTLLGKAFRYGDVEAVKILLTHSDINVNIPGDERNKTLLHWAVDRDDLEMVKSLLNKSAQVNIKDKYDQTPLDIACGKNPLPVEIVKLLVDKLTKEEINAVDNKGDTLLHRALDYYANEELAKILLSHTDIDVKIKGEHNTIPLHLAVYQGYSEIIKILLNKRDGQVGMKDDRGETPLDIAISKGFLPLEIVKLLVSKLTKLEINAVDNDGNTLLHKAFRYRDVEAVNILLTHSDIDVKIPGEHFKTPLHWAAEWDNLEIVTNLLNKDAQVGIKDGYGGTPLDIALGQHPLSLEIVKLLVSKLTKEEINAVDNRGETLLYKALDYHQEELAKILLTRSDIDVNLPNKYKKVPLHLAVEWGNLEIVTTLLNKDAKAGVKDNYDRTPLDIVRRENPLPVAIVKLLVSKLTKEEINAVDDNNRGTLLYKALDDQQEELAKILLTRSDIDVNIPNHIDRTPLYWASSYGYVEIVRNLLNKGAKVNIKDLLGYTPLDVAKTAEIKQLLQDSTN